MDGISNIIWDYLTLMKQRILNIWVRWNFKWETTALHIAVEKGDEKEALRLIKEEWASVEKKNAIGFSSMRIAANCDNYKMLKLLAPYSSNPDKNLHGQIREMIHNRFTALNLEDCLFDIYATHPGINLSKFWYYNVLQMVVEFVPENVHVIEQLLHQGFDPNIQDRHGNNCLHIISSVGSLASAYDKLRVATMFLDKGVDINCRNSFNNTPLHVAVNQDISLIALYLERGADVNLMCLNKSTPFDDVIQMGNSNLYTLFLKYIALSKHQGRPIAKSNMEHIEANSEFKEISMKFDEELESLKLMKITDSYNYTYHHIINWSVHKVARLLRNEKILDGITDDTTRQNSYENDILYKIVQAKKINEVQNMATKVINEIFENKLPDLCTKRISSFFHIRDMDVLNSFLNFEETSTSVEERMLNQ